jgi:nucleotide-binding universal stress UspA family protein
MNGPLVIGTDGSETANRALAVAIDLAKTYEQPLHVVCGYHPQSVSTDGLPAEVASLITPDSWAESVLDDAASRARFRGFPITPHAHIGGGAEAILAVADEVDAALIVVGNRGIGSKARYVLGNVPSKVVHHARCSVHVVNTASS